MRDFGTGFRCVFLCIAVLAGALGRAHAQGGPPMITDDPGTPGDGHWEINLAWTDTRAPGSTELGLPFLDANYGVGDRLQLNYQGSWNVLRESGEPAVAGLSDSAVAVKWRFYDAGEQGWQASLFPRVTFLTPGSHSDRRGLADPHTTFLLPFEVLKDLGFLSVDADFGRMFSAAREDEGWMGGLCVGREIAKGFELDAEVHATTTERVNRSEITANLGARIDLSAHTTLLLALGRDLRDTIAPRSSLLTYAGIQLRW